MSSPIDEYKEYRKICVEILNNYKQCIYDTYTDKPRNNVISLNDNNTNCNYHIELFTKFCMNPVQNIPNKY
jgi:hypothetical protein